MEDAANTLQNEAASEGTAIGRRLRRSYEAGHHPKFLVLVDDTEDCGKAVYYASRRGARVGATVVLLRVIEPFPADLVLLGVSDVMRSQAQQEAQELLERYEGFAR